ncbi:MAG: tetratricopeptide repeat protein, partial [Gammaproteobacteria bacterium]|nr:tetratricopeptide repeat protein [Gammaproteobacteria bacterium]
MAGARSQPTKLTSADIQALLKKGFDALTAGRIDEAGACCQKVLSVAPKAVAAHFLVGLIANETGETKVAIHAFGSVTKLEPNHSAAWAQLARNFMKLGMPQRAEDAVKQAIKADTKDPMVEDLIGATLSSLGDQPGAREWFDRAVKKKPRSPMFNQNLASTLIFLGEKDKAEEALDRVLEVSPREPQAHWRKSGLIKARDHSHLDVLNELMAHYRNDPRSLSFVAYAAGKEYEDLEEWEDAFRCFETGARAKRQFVEYDEAAEIQMFDAIKDTFTPAWIERETRGIEADSPIFIVGQPRTGTTLVERIITSHSMVHSAGELQQFGLSVRRHAQVESRERFPAEMFRMAANIDPARIGATYMLSSDSMQGSLPRFVDKMPVNYLFI